jgi:hypothetical protein
MFVCWHNFLLVCKWLLSVRICKDLLLFNLFLDYNLSETKHLKPKQKIDKLLLVVYI